MAEDPKAPKSPSTDEAKAKESTADSVDPASKLTNALAATPASAPLPKAIAPPEPHVAKPEIPKPPPWYLTLRQPAPLWMGYVIGASSLLALALLWQVFGGAPGSTKALILPKLGDVFGAYERLSEMGLYGSIWASLRRVLVGFALAVAVGFSLGILAASFRAVYSFLSPLVTFLRSLPMGAVVPLTIVWFGIGEKQKEMFIFIACLPFVMSDVIKAVSLVPQRYIETAETLGASRWQCIVKVLIPLALPDVITGLRFMFGLSLGYIMLAEAINPQAGLGYLIQMSNSRGGAPEPIYLLLIIIGILAYLIDWVVRFFQRGIFPYRKDL